MSPSRPLQIVSATANPDKLREMRAILGPGFDILPRPADVPEVVEDASTLEGNARLKARAVCAATGEAAVADDTGLEVDAIGGRPGVRSARYAGAHAVAADNVAKLLSELVDVAWDGRTARFRTVAIVVWPDGREVLAEGVAEGRIATRPVGRAGFGYDPLFVPADGDGRTFAQMSEVDKNALSHRGRAFRALGARLSG